MLVVVVESSLVISLQGIPGRDGIPGHAGASGDTVSWPKIVNM